MNNKRREIEQSILVEMCVVGLLVTVVAALVIPLTFRTTTPAHKILAERSDGANSGPFLQTAALESEQSGFNRARQLSPISN